MNKYEIMFIVRPDMEEAQIKKVAEDMKKVLTDKKAKVIEEKAMGQRELAYEIRKFNTGYYYLFVVEANADAEQEFTRVARINESLLRHLIVKVDEEEEV
jgi:small subunit ribosomal protein S6